MSEFRLLDNLTDADLDALLRETPSWRDNFRIILEQFKRRRLVYRIKDIFRRAAYVGKTIGSENDNRVSRHTTSDRSDCLACRLLDNWEVAELEVAFLDDLALPDLDHAEATAYWESRDQGHVLRNRRVPPRPTAPAALTWVHYDLLTPQERQFRIKHFRTLRRLHLVGMLLKRRFSPGEDRHKEQFDRIAVELGSELI